MRTRRWSINTAVRPVKRKRIDNLIRFVVLAYYISRHISENEDERYNNFYKIVTEILRKIA